MDDNKGIELSEEVKIEEPEINKQQKKAKLRGLFFGETTETKLKKQREKRKITQRTQKNSRRNNAR